MKKHTFMLFTASAMLSLNAFAPQLMWEKNHSTFRAPSSMEEDRLEELEMKKLEVKRMKEIEIEKAKAKDATVQCKNDQSASLEDQMKKLLADKESLIKELNELKALKKAKLNEVTAEVVEEAPKKALNAKKESPDLMMILSQVTSFMVSQQEQQAKMMNFFFSMMPYMQQQRPTEQRSQYFSPYAFTDGDRFSQPYTTDYSLIGRNSHRIGLGTRFDNYSNYSKNEEQSSISGPGMRVPSQVFEKSNNQYDLLQRNYFEPQRSQYPVIHDGYNFGASGLTNFSRTQI